MARTISVIRKFLADSLVAAGLSVGKVVTPSNWSVTDYKKLILDVVATGEAITEQLYDSHLEDVENAALLLPPQTAPWFQDKMKNLFEYDAVAVPIVQFNPITLVPYYPNPNPSFHIVKYCSVVSGNFGTTTIKIAGAGPSQIGSTALAAAQSFVNTLGVPGITYNVTSGISDKLFLQIDVNYNGLYSATIQAAVTLAINQYLSGIDFNGIVDISDLLVAIKKVAGVISVVFVNVKARDNSTPAGSGVSLVLNKTTLQRNFSTVAGYIIPESAAGFTLSDYRTGTSGPLNLNLIPQ